MCVGVLERVLAWCLIVPLTRSLTPAAARCAVMRCAGVSGPIAFDSKGDLLPHDGVYITITFDPKTGEMVFGNTVDLPDF